MSNKDKVWYASVCFGRQRHGKVRFGLARCGEVLFYKSNTVTI